MGSTVAKVVEAIRNLPHPTMLAFDVDGTLAPICDNPSEAMIPEIVKTQLRALTDSPNFYVALLSGRDEQSLLKIMDTAPFWVALEHGVSINPPGAKRSRKDSTLDPTISGFRDFAENRWSSRGALIEKKKHSVGVHVRHLAKSNAEQAERILEEVRAEAIKRKLEYREGRAVLEVSRETSDKGSALRLMFQHAAAASVVFLGDDLTDFPAFEVAQQLGGLGIFVESGERQMPESASLSLTDPSEVHAVVAKLQLLG